MNRRGQKINGEMTAENPAFVKANLRRQGITPTKVKKKKQSLCLERRVVGLSRQTSRCLCGKWPP
jgi:type II secretory pathway component PulF